MLKKYKDLILLLICLIAIFQLYLYTTFPAFKNDDSPETTTSAFTLGISRPPGYPLFTMLGKTFSLLPLASPAFRINSLSIFISVIILYLTYFLIRRNMSFIFNYEKKLINIFSVFVTAFSYIYWNLAIEAKGGIYMLNLLFLAILLYLSIELFKTFNIKQMYLMSFIYGLSLANHWPSTIILLPVFAYFYVKYRQKLTFNRMFSISLFSILGISPYIYLPIRSNADGIFIFITRSNTWEMFWWTVLRGVYTNFQMQTMAPYIDQIKEFVTLFLNNFTFIWILFLFGAYIIFKKNKKLLFFYFAAFLIIVFMVVIYNRSSKENLWVLENFLLPAEYLLIIPITAGVYFIIEILKNKKFSLLFISLFVCAILNLGFRSLKANYQRYNYLSYDFGNNELVTMEKDSIYIPFSDFYGMPLSYLQMVEHKTDDFNIYMLYNLSNQGIAKKFGRDYLKNDKIEINIEDLTERYYGKSNVYFSDYRKELIKNPDKNVTLKIKGLLFKIANINDYIPPWIFKNYAYRGIFNVNNDYDKTLISKYSSQLNNQGYDLLMIKKYDKAIETFKYALLFPDNPYKINTYFNLFTVYKELNDEDNEIKCLKSMVKIKQDYFKAYEILGMIYYNEKLWIPAKVMFEKAVQYDSENSVTFQQYVNQIGDANTYSQYKVLSDQAAAFVTSGRYLKALDLFEFLLEQNYATGEVYKNMGICNLKINNFEESLKYFQKALEMDKSVENFINIANTYNKLGQSDKALNTLREEMQTVGNDPQLVNLYNQIEQTKNKTK